MNSKNISLGIHLYSRTQRISGEVIKHSVEDRRFTVRFFDGAQEYRYLDAGDFIEVTPIAKLRIGDVVVFPHDGEHANPNGQLTVIKADGKEVKFFRPYVSLGDFVHTGGVTPYIGIEEFSVPVEGSSHVYEVLGNIFHERSIA